MSLPGLPGWVATSLEPGPLPQAAPAAPTTAPFQNVQEIRAHVEGSRLVQDQTSDTLFIVPRPRSAAAATAARPVQKERPEPTNEVLVRVGSVKFVVPFRLLRQEPQSNLCKLIDGEWDVARDECDGSFTILRSPHLFADVLQLLAGQMDLPFGDEESFKRLLAELEFYGLHQLRGRLVALYPTLGRLHEATFGLRFDGLYFAIYTPAISCLANGEFDFVSPENLVRALRFRPDGTVIHFKARRSWSADVALQKTRTGRWAYVPIGVSCSLAKPPRGNAEPKEAACVVSLDSKQFIVITYKERPSKAIFKDDEVLATWLRIPVE